MQRSRTTGSRSCSGESQMPDKLSEADLCDAFSRWAKPMGWTAYPETSGWDLLMVRSDGTQLGIQAKRAFNATLLRQVIPTGSKYIDKSGPEYRGILLPTWTKDVSDVCRFCGLVYFHPGRAKRHRSEGDGRFDAEFVPVLDPDKWQVWPADTPVHLPEYVPDVRGGASAPLQLTAWKIAALKICALLEIRGHVCRGDFKTFGIDYRRWVPMEWLVFDNVNHWYVRGPALAFDKQHPVNYVAVLEDIKKWLTEEPKVTAGGKASG